MCPPPRWLPCTLEELSEAQAGKLGVLSRPVWLGRLLDLVTRRPEICPAGGVLAAEARSRELSENVRSSAVAGSGLCKYTRPLIAPPPVVNTRSYCLSLPPRVSTLTVPCPDVTAEPRTAESI